MHGRGWIFMWIRLVWRSNSKRSKLFSSVYILANFFDSFHRWVFNDAFHKSFLAKIVMSAELTWVNHRRWKKNARRARCDEVSERSGTECRNVGEGRDGQYATYRVADAARNDFYMSNKWVLVDTLGRQFGSAKRERERKNGAKWRVSSLLRFSRHCSVIIRRSLQVCLLKRRKREIYSFTRFPSNFVEEAKINNSNRYII